ncbi:hypothetical protein BGZ65_004678 [Modicella reniformis]|uniref:Uncharacterized protein n=1 Tax=Modicella reniformis TaxID=1440133 RepID=A0A9P6IYA8_9FUNG|nr:hypothetical protein BGZ65_004678 [Modicella reniformis]
MSKPWQIEISNHRSMIVDKPLETRGAEQTHVDVLFVHSVPTGICRIKTTVRVEDDYPVDGLPVSQLVWKILQGRITLPCELFLTGVITVAVTSFMNKNYLSATIDIRRYDIIKTIMRNQRSDSSSKKKSDIADTVKNMRLGETDHERATRSTINRMESCSTSAISSSSMEDSIVSDDDALVNTARLKRKALAEKDLNVETSSSNRTQALPLRKTRGPPQETPSSSIRGPQMAKRGGGVTKRGEGDRGRGRGRG